MLRIVGADGTEPARRTAKGTLVALRPQPPGTPWPTDRWPQGDTGGVPLGHLLDEVFDDGGPLGRTYAVVLVHHGRLVAERYGGRLEHFDRPAETIGPDTPLLSWSMAKSMLQAAVGILVGEGRMSLDQPATVPEWSEPGDPRAAITVDHLLAMRDGLRFVEDYVDERVSDVIEMLFGRGQDDVAHYAADRPLATAPGDAFNYSSGTSNVLSGVVAGLVGRGDAYAGWLHDRLFAPIGATTARATTDPAGTWVASSYVYATAQDFARFGLLYLRDGIWDGRRILPGGWVDEARRPRSVDPEDGALYGSHWWVVGDEHGSFECRGYRGQRITVCPALDLVAVRLGKTPYEREDNLDPWRVAVVQAFADAG